MTREHKLALIVGFALILVVGVFVSDHFSKARLAKPDDRLATSAGMPVGQQRPPVAFPVQAPEPVAAAPAPAAEHQPGELTMRQRPTLGGSLAGDVGSAYRGPGLAGSGDVRLNPANQLPAAANVVDVPGEGAVPLVRDPRADEPSSKPAATPVARPVSAGELRRHTVAKGDSLAKISAKYYGDDKLWRRLAEYNSSRVGANASVNQGVTLLIPPRDVLLGQATLAPEGSRPTPVRDQPPAPRKTEVAKADPSVKPGAPKGDAKKPEAPKAVERSYTVKSGDTLALIAERELGSGKRWREIQKLNAGLLGDEDTIAVGMVLKLPAAGKS